MRCRVLVLPGRALVSDGAARNSSDDTEGDFDVPEETEEALENLFQSLQDKVSNYPTSSSDQSKQALRIPLSVIRRRKG